MTKEYAGGGLMGQLAAEFDAEQQEVRAHARARREKDRARWAALEEPAQELDNLVESLTAATLLAAGFHRHDRGAWRRRRE